MNKVGEAVVTTADFEVARKSNDPVFCAIGLAIARVDLSHVDTRGKWGFCGNGELYCSGGNCQTYKHLYVEYRENGNGGAIQEGVFHRRHDIEQKLRQGESVKISLMEWTQADEDDFWTKMMSQ